MALCLPGALILPGRGLVGPMGRRTMRARTSSESRTPAAHTSPASPHRRNVPHGGGGSWLLPPGPGDSCSTGPHRRGLPARAGHVRTVRPNTTWKPHDSGFLLTRPRKGFVGGVHAGDIGKGLGWSVGHTTDAHEGAPTSALSYTTSLRTHVTPTKPFSEPRVGSPPPVSNPSVAPVNTSAPEVAAVRPCPRPYP